MSHELTKKRALKNIFNALTTTELEKSSLIINELIEDKKRKEKEVEQEAIEKQSKIEQALAYISELNIKVEDLGTNPKTVKKPKKQVQDKYSITDSNGVEHTWSGRGKTPVAFELHMKNKGIDKSELPIIS